MHRTWPLVVCLMVAMAVPCLAQDDDTWQDRFPKSATALTVSGPTGALYTPTTDIVNRSTIQLGFHWVDQVTDAAPAFGVGLTDDLEAGICLWDPWDFGGVHWRSELSGHIKWRALDEDGGRPAIALGATIIGDRSDEINFYGVVSKKFDCGLPCNANVGWVWTDAWGDDIFGSLQVGLAQDVSILGEYDGDDVNAFLRYAHNNDSATARGPVIDVGVTDWNDFFAGGSWVVPY